jgi:hypothetical protein
VGEPIPIVVGSKGMGWGIGLIDAGQPGVRFEPEPIKIEGDGKSPAGVFALGTAFGYAAQPPPGLKLPYLVLAPSIECVDDASSKNYNRIVDRSTVAPDWNSSEHMRDVGESYRWGVVIDHNATVPGRTAPRPGGGSCVFLHIWHSPDRGTAPAPLARSISAACARPTARVGISAFCGHMESSTAAGACCSLTGRVATRPNPRISR